MFSVPGKTALSHLVNVPVVFANKGTFDGLSVVLAKKIAADAKEEKPTLTHDKTQSVEAENIIDWLNDPASKEIVDQIQITTDMNTTAENAVVALAEAFMKNEYFQKKNLDIVYTRY